MQCQAPGCDRTDIAAKRLCKKHYYRDYMKTYDATRQRKTPEQRERNRLQTTERRRTRMGCTPEMADKLRELQHGRCAICPASLVPNTKQEHLDHDHGSGLVRGFLCNICNITLGMYERRQRPAGLRLEPYEKYLASTRQG
ncbi:MAG: Citrobacter phage [Pseudomonadota bacterium]|jgi:hypothetical protein